MATNGNHIERDHNGKDISYIREAFRERRELKKELGTDEDNIVELRKKRASNNPNGRPYKGEEKREAVTFRLQPKTIDRIRHLAHDGGMSQSDVVEEAVSSYFGD